MPKLKNKNEAIRQVLIAAGILKKKMKELGKDINEIIIGKGETSHLLGSKDGKGLKPVFVQAVKQFGIRRFTDPDLEYVFEVIDEDKPLLRVRRL